MTDYFTVQELPTPIRIFRRLMMSKKDSRSYSQRSRKMTMRLYRELPPPPTESAEAFMILLNLLGELTQWKYAEMARQAGVTTQTIKKWIISPPKQWYWPYVLFTALRTGYHHWRATQGKRTKKYHATVRQAGVILGFIAPHGTDEYQVLPRGFRQGLNHNHRADVDVFDPITSIEEVKRAIIVECARNYFIQPHTFRLGHGFSKERMERAAAALSMIKSQTGFGANKEAHWTLPPEWGLDEEQGTVEVASATAAEKKAAPVKFERRSKEYYEKLGRED